MGGKIIQGQGTPTIQVKINSSRNEVAAEVEIGGMEEYCYCLLKSTFTTKIHPARKFVKYPVSQLIRASF